MLTKTDPHPRLVSELLSILPCHATYDDAVLAAPLAPLLKGLEVQWATPLAEKVQEISRFGFQARFFRRCNSCARRMVATS